MKEESVLSCEDYQNKLNLFLNEICEPILKRKISLDKNQTDKFLLGIILEFTAMQIINREDFDLICKFYRDYMAKNENKNNGREK